MCAGVDLSKWGPPSGLGRLERTLLDAGRRGVPGVGVVMVGGSPPVLCAQSGVCLRARRVEDLRVRWKDTGWVRGWSHREKLDKG
jgi:hypothetical protein